MNSIHTALFLTRETIMIFPLIIPVSSQITVSLLSLLKKVVLVTFLVEIVMFIFFLLLPFWISNTVNAFLCIFIFLFLRKNRCLTTFTFMVYIYECLSFRFLRLPFLLYNRYPFISPQHCSSLQSFNSTYDRAVFRMDFVFSFGLSCKKISWLAGQLFS